MNRKIGSNKGKIMLVDLYDYKIENAINEIINKTKYSSPVKLALTKELNSSHFKIIK